MIKVGDIVYRKRRGGIIQRTSDVITSKIGLVIKEYNERGAPQQFYVQFDQQTPKWFLQPDLHRIGGERNKNA